MGFEINADSFVRATKAIEKQVKANQRAFGELVGREYKSDAKKNAPWVNRKGIARGGIGYSVSQTEDKIKVRMYGEAPNYKRSPLAVADYMEVLEFGMGGRFAIVYPTFESLKAGIQAVYGEAVLTGSAVSLRRDKAWAKRRMAKFREKKKGDQKRYKLAVKGK